MPKNSLSFPASNFSLGFDEEQKNPNSQEGFFDEPIGFEESPVEPDQQQYNLEMSGFLNQFLTASQSQAMSAFIKPDFIKEEPLNRYTILCKLSCNPKFIDFLNDNPRLAYKVLMQSVENEPNLVTQLRNTKELSNFIVNIEIEEFPEKFENWLKAKTGSYAFSYGLYHHLSPNFFTKNIEERFAELEDLKQDADFIRMLDLGASELGNLTDRFLRRSAENDPHYLKILLDSNSLWEKYLHSTKLDKLDNAFNKVVKSDPSKEDALETYPERKRRKRRQTTMTESGSTLSAYSSSSKHPVFGNSAPKQEDSQPTFQYN